LILCGLFSTAIRIWCTFWFGLNSTVAETFKQILDHRLTYDGDCRSFIPPAGHRENGSLPAEEDAGQEGCQGSFFFLLRSGDVKLLIYLFLQTLKQA
jgi:hypothetical protein